MNTFKSSISTSHSPYLVNISEKLTKSTPIEDNNKPKENNNKKLLSSCHSTSK